MNTIITYLLMYSYKSEYYICVTNLSNAVHLGTNLVAYIINLTIDPHLGLLVYSFRD